MCPAHQTSSQTATNGGKRASISRSVIGVPIPEETDDITFIDHQGVNIDLSKRDAINCQSTDAASCSTTNMLSIDTPFVTARSCPDSPSASPTNVVAVASSSNLLRKFFSAQSLRAGRRSKQTLNGSVHTSPRYSNDAASVKKRFISEGDTSVEMKNTVTCPEFHSQYSLPIDNKGPRNVKKYYKNMVELQQSFERDAKAVEEYMLRKEATQRKQQQEQQLRNNALNDAQVASDDDDDASSGIQLPFDDGGQDDKLLDIDKPDFDDVVAEKPDYDKQARRLSQISLLANVLLLIIKIVATYITGSYSIISSLVDSCVDLTSGAVIWTTERAIRKRDPYLYPRGRTRLTPIALVIISVVMAVASIQVIVQSMEAIISGDFHPYVHIVPIVLMVVTICVKLALFALCMMKNKSNDPSINVLGLDHRNDCISNSVAILCAYAGDHLWKYVDPIGAVVVSLYIAFTWFSTGYDQIIRLSGRTAEPAFVNRILKVCLKHDERIRFIDTIYVYHFGTKFLVEVHVVLDPDMSVREAHDISEPLQNKLEHLDYVERAFVHVDYDIEHRPEDEHVVV